MQQTQLSASQSNRFSGLIQKVLYSLIRHQRIPSCTGDYFIAAATTTPAPVTNSLQRQLPLLHRQPLPCRSSYQFCTSSYQPCTSDRLTAPAITFLHTTSVHFPAPADTCSHQFFTSDYQSWTSDHLPAPTDTSNYQSRTSDHIPAPADTSNYQFCISNYQS